MLGSILWAGLGSRRNAPKLFKTGPCFLHGLDASGLVIFFFLGGLFPCLAFLRDAAAPALGGWTRRVIDECEGSQPERGCQAAGMLAPEMGQADLLPPKSRLSAQSSLTGDLN